MKASSIVFVPAVNTRHGFGIKLAFQLFITSSCSPVYSSRRSPQDSVEDLGRLINNFTHVYEGGFDLNVSMEGSE